MSTHLTKRKPKEGQTQENVAGKSLSRDQSTPGAPASAHLLDTIDRLILEALQHNARIPYAELARQVHLSTPAVIERVRRLEERGVLLGYRAEVNPAALGLQVRAFVKVTVAGDRLAAFSALVRDIPEILECHRVTGNESFLAQVLVRDMDHLETVIDSLMPYVSTNTSIVLNSPVSRATLAPHTGVPPAHTPQSQRKRL